MLAKLRTQDDHTFATGRRFKLGLPPPFSSRLSRDTSGNIRAQEVARVAAHGYTLLVAAANNFVINQFLMKMSFDPLTALPPIAKVADIPLIFCSNPSVPVHDLPGFVQYARARRGELNYSSLGNESNNHLLSRSSSSSRTSSWRTFPIAAHLSR